MKKKYRFYSIVLLVLITFTSLSFVGCGSNKTSVDAGKDTAKSDILKVAMILSGPINDAGWNQSAYEGLKEAETKYKVEGAYTENVAQPDQQSVIRDYADKGYGLVICHGFQFSDAVKAVAPSFPNVTFAVVNGDSFQEPNMLSFRFNTPETGFLAGAVAGLSTKTNTVAMIGGTKAPHIVDALKGFEAGAKYVNPNVNAITGFTESDTDVAKGKEMAMAMIEKGADVISCNANQVGLGVIDAAKNKNIKAIGYISDQNKVAPDTVIVSSIQSVNFMVMNIVSKKVNNDVKPAVYLSGYNDGAIYLSDWHGNDKNLPAGAMDKINEILKGIKDGSLKEKGILPKSVFEK
jgi:basic membrane protein A